MVFDPDKILGATVTGPMSTAPVLCPEGEWKALTDDGDKALTFRSFAGKDGKPDSHQCQLLWSIVDDGVKAILKRDKVLVPQTMWLDLNERDELDLSEGKNVGLGRTRKALGQNDGAWSPGMMKGKGPCLVKVSHRADPKDPSIKYAEVTRVSSLTS